jgi:hypothetical protein
MHLHHLQFHNKCICPKYSNILVSFLLLQSEALAGDPHHQGPVQLWGRLHAWHKLAQEHASAEELQQLGMAGLDEEVCYIVCFPVKERL